MATKKKVEDTVQTEQKIDIKATNGRLSLVEMSEIVNTVVDSVFTERNGNIEFAGELYEVLLAYMEVGAFYPHTGVFENGLGLFFGDYIDNKYHKELEELKYNRLVQYIENAVNKKVEARMKQIENPLINSMTKLVDAANVLAEKYVDDIDNVGTSDMKGFITNFVELSKKTNPDTVAEKVIKMYRAEMEKKDKSETAVVEKAAPKQRKSKKIS